jgi:transcriptional regulator with XRE-family HTH domain
MKLSEKIQRLRKENKYSQETLAEACGVSRQAISKWEADIALPETYKIILMSNLFEVSINVLLKDELVLDGIKEIQTCGKIMNTNYETGIYEGLLIKESIENEAILDYVSINKVEIWKTGGKPKYWTAISFTSIYKDFPTILSKAVIADEEKGGNWFADMKSGNVKIIVFKDAVLKYEIGNKVEKDNVCDECRIRGIPDEQMKWSE